MLIKLIFEIFPSVTILNYDGKPLWKGEKCNKFYVLLIDVNVQVAV